MPQCKSTYVRSMRDSERDVARDVTLAAYEEYAAIVPEPFWTGYRRQLLETLNAQGPADRILAERQGLVVGSVFLFPPAANAYASAAGGTESPERCAFWPCCRQRAARESGPR
jgi:hypothetical protein